MRLKGAFAFTSASLATGTAAAQGLSGPVVNTGPVAIAAAGAALMGTAWMAGKLITKAGRAALGTHLPAPNIDQIIPFIRIDTSDNQTVISERTTYTVDGRKTARKHEVRFVAIEFEGIDYASNTPETLETFRRSRLTWQARLAEYEAAAEFIFDRRLFDVQMPPSVDNEWLREVNDTWSANFMNAFSNGLYVLIIDEGTGNLEEAVKATLTILKPAGPRILRHREAVMVDEDELGAGRQRPLALPLRLCQFRHAGAPAAVGPRPAAIAEGRRLRV